MIMDAGLLTVTSVRENNNQHTGSESAVLAPRRNADTSVSVSGEKCEKTPPSPPGLGADLSSSRAFPKTTTRFALLEETWGSLLVELEG